MTDTPITDAQVEAVARRYCVLMGLAPDADVTEDHWAGFDRLMRVSGPRWTHFREMVRRPIAMTRAVREVMGG